MKTDVTHEEKIARMREWCAEQGLQLDLAGEVGFGRECVGVRGPAERHPYPDYEWHGDDEDSWDRIDKNGEVWTPPNAYHKHPCVAVLGRGEGPEAELYDWLMWFAKNGFRYQTERNTKRLHGIELLMGRDTHHRMVKP